MSKFLKLIVDLFMLAAIAVAAAILVPPLLGVNQTIVDSVAMTTNLPLGSVTYSTEVDVEDLKAGDEVLKETDAATYAYIIRSGDETTGQYNVVSIANPDGAEEQIYLRNSVPKVAVIVPFIGYLMIAMHSVEGLIIIALVIILVIILFALSELWKPEYEYDEEEEDESEIDEETGIDTGAVKAAMEANVAAVNQEEEPEDEQVMTRAEKRAEKKARKQAEKAAKEAAKKGLPIAGEIGLPEELLQPNAAEAEEDAQSSEESKNVYDSVQQVADAAAELYAERGAGTSAGEDTDSSAEASGEEYEVKPITEIPKIMDVSEITDIPELEGISEISEFMNEDRIPAFLFNKEGEEETPDEEPEEESEQFAMVQRQSLDEMMSDAQLSGDAPKIIQEGSSGVTVLDFSDLL